MSWCRGDHCWLDRAVGVRCILLGNEVVTFAGAKVVFLVIRRGSDLQVCRSPEALIKVAIDSTSHCRWEMTASVSAARDHNHCQSWIGQRCIRGEQPYPASSASITGTR